MLLGVIADDFTGASDIANTLCGGRHKHVGGGDGVSAVAGGGAAEDAVGAVGAAGAVEVGAGAVIRVGEGDSFDSRGEGAGPLKRGKGRFAGGVGFRPLKRTLRRAPANDGAHPGAVCLR